MLKHPGKALNPGGGLPQTLLCPATLPFLSDVRDSDICQKHFPAFLGSSPITSPRPLIRVGGWGAGTRVPVGSGT